MIVLCVELGSIGEGRDFRGGYGCFGVVGYVLFSVFWIGSWNI